MFAQANFAKRAASTKGPIYFIRTQDESGSDAYYVLQVSPPREATFCRAMRGTAMVDYASFGTILASGFTHMPDERIIAMLKRDYNYDLPE